MGAVSSEMVIQKVENAKPLISFGVLFSDIVMGGFTDHLDRGHVIECTDTHVNIGFHTYQDVPLWAFLPALIQAASDAGYRGYGQIAHKQYSFTAVQGKGLSVVRLMECVASFLDEKIRLIVDPGDCLFGSVELPAQSLMLASGYYATMGYAVPAALGAAKADPSLRPMVLVGDGAFLMTGLELLSATYHGVKPIVIVVDNEGYGTQRPMDDGPFNDIPALRSEELPRAFGVGVGLLCNSEDELHAALNRATQTEEFFIIRARVPKGQYSPGLIRLTSALKKRI